MMWYQYISCWRLCLKIILEISHHVKNGILIIYRLYTFLSYIMLQEHLYGKQLNMDWSMLGPAAGGEEGVRWELSGIYISLILTYQRVQALVYVMMYMYICIRWRCVCGSTHMCSSLLPAVVHVLRNRHNVAENGSMSDPHSSLFSSRTGVTCATNHHTYACPCPCPLLCQNTTYESNPHILWLDGAIIIIDDDHCTVYIQVCVYTYIYMLCFRYRISLNRLPPLVLVLHWAVPKHT